MENDKKDSVIEQMLLHLYDCIDYGFSCRMKKGLFIENLFLGGRWKSFSREEIENGYKNLKKSKFIIQKEKYDGSVIVSLSEKGKLRAVNLKFKRLYHKKVPWDKKWRMVAFDIPNIYRKGRRALRYRLKIAGFRELQESIFIYPYDCRQELADFVKLFKLERFVRFGLLDFIDGQDYFVKVFKLEAV